MASTTLNEKPTASLDRSELIYFKVMHSGGLVVRSEPNLTAESTGRVIACDSIITSRREPFRDGDNLFIEASDGGWVIAQKGNLQACVRINGPIVTSGEWLYEVVHPSGTRFAKSSNIAEASERNEMLHPKGSVIKAVCKKTDLGSIITTVQLDNNYGWIFEHSATGQVLDRLGNELVVVPVDDYREIREFWGKVVATDGVGILTTPTETSVSKERIENDKIFQCTEVLNVPIHATEGNSGGAAIGATRYFRLKDGKGWIIAMRKSIEPAVAAAGANQPQPNSGADATPTTNNKDDVKGAAAAGAADKAPSSAGGGGAVVSSFVDVIEIPDPPPSSSSSLPVGTTVAAATPSISSSNLPPPPPPSSSAATAGARSNGSTAPSSSSTPAAVAATGTSSSGVLLPPVVPPSNTAATSAAPPTSTGTTSSTTTAPPATNINTTSSSSASSKTATTTTSSGSGAPSSAPSSSAASLLRPPPSLTAAPTSTTTTSSVAPAAGSTTSGATIKTDPHQPQNSSSTALTSAAAQRAAAAAQASASGLPLLSSTLSSSLGLPIGAIVPQLSAYPPNFPSSSTAAAVSTTAASSQPFKVVEDIQFSAWYRVVYKGGIRLRRSPAMNDVIESTLPVGCWVKTCRRIVQQAASLKRERERADPLGDTTAAALGSGEGAPVAHGRTQTFLQLVACVGARVRVADSWIFERAPDSAIIAAEQVPEPRVESPPGLVLMVLYPGGITLRESPHMSANKTDHVVKMYDCHSAQGMISTADGLEAFALLSGGLWLPCKAPGGLEVAVRVPRMPTSRAGFFEVTMKRDCSTLYGPFPDTPSLPHILPKGVVLPFDLLLWYPSSSGAVSAADIFLRLQQNDPQSQAPAIWIRRDDDVVSIIERTPTL